MFRILFHPLVVPKAPNLKNYNYSNTRRWFEKWGIFLILHQIAVFLKKLKKSSTFQISAVCLNNYNFFKFGELLVQPVDEKVSKTLKLLIFLEVLVVCLFPINIICFICFCFSCKTSFCFPPHSKWPFFGLTQKMSFDQNLDCMKKKLCGTFSMICVFFHKKNFFFDNYWLW